MQRFIYLQTFLDGWVGGMNYGPDCRYCITGQKRIMGAPISSVTRAGVPCRKALSSLQRLWIQVPAWGPLLRVTTLSLILCPVISLSCPNNKTIQRLTKMHNDQLVKRQLLFTTANNTAEEMNQQCSSLRFWKFWKRKLNTCTLKSLLVTCANYRHTHIASRTPPLSHSCSVKTKDIGVVSLIRIY